MVWRETSRRLMTCFRLSQSECCILPNICYEKRVLLTEGEANYALSIDLRWSTELFTTVSWKVNLRECVLSGFRCEEDDSCAPLGYYAASNPILFGWSNRDEIGGACSTYGESEGVYRVLVGKHKGKRPLGRHRRRREYNIKMDLQEVVCRGRDWIVVDQGRDRWRALVKAVMNLWVP